MPSPSIAKNSIFCVKRSQRCPFVVGCGGMSSVSFGGARLPNDLTIESKPQMISVKMVLRCLRTCRAVIERLVTARRVFVPIDIIRQDTTSFSGLKSTSLGSLAPPKNAALPHQRKRSPTTDERELIPTDSCMCCFRLDVICTTACLNIRT